MPPDPVPSALMKVLPEANPVQFTVQTRKSYTARVLPVEHEVTVSVVLAMYPLQLATWTGGDVETGVTVRVVKSCAAGRHEGSLSGQVG